MLTLEEIEKIKNKTNQKTNKNGLTLEEVTAIRNEALKNQPTEEKTQDPNVSQTQAQKNQALIKDLESKGYTINYATPETKQKALSGETNVHMATKEDYKRLAEENEAKSSETLKNAIGNISSFVYGVGEKPAKAIMNVQFTTPVWKNMLSSVEAGNKAREKLGIEKVDTSYWENKVEEQEKRLKQSKQKVDTAFEQLEGYVAPNQTAKAVGNVAGYLALGKGLTSSGVSAPLTYGGLSAVEEYADGGSARDTAVEFAKGALFGKFLKTFKGGSKALQTVGKKTLAEYGKYFIKSYLSFFGANASTQALDFLKEEPNFDYVDWGKVQQGITSGKYKSVEDYLDSSEYVLDVLKNRFKVANLNALIGSLIDTGATAYADSKIQIQLNGKRNDALSKLGLTENATKDEIRKAYRKFAKLYHPDVNTGNLEKYLEIQNAYNFLTNTTTVPVSTTPSTQPTSTTAPVTVNKTPQANVSNTINNIVQNVPVSSIVQKTPEIVENLPENEKISQELIQNVSNLQETRREDTSVIEDEVVKLNDGQKYINMSGYNYNTEKEGRNDTYRFLQQKENTEIHTSDDKKYEFISKLQNEDGKNKDIIKELQFSNTQFQLKKTDVNKKQLKEKILQNLPQLIQESRYYRLKDDIGETHKEWGIKQFETRTSIVKFKDNFYKVYMDMAVLDNGKRIPYAIKKIKTNNSLKAKNESSLAITAQRAKVALDNSHDDSLTQKNDYVNNEKLKNKISNVKNSKEQGSFSLPKIPKNHIRLYRGLENKYDSNYDKTKLDNVNGYESWTDSYELARQYGNNVYYIDVPLNEVGTEVTNEDGDRFLVYKNNKPAGLNNVTGDEYMLYTDHEKFRDVKYNEVLRNNTPLKVDLHKTKIPFTEVESLLNDKKFLYDKISSKLQDSLIYSIPTDTDTDRLYKQSVKEIIQEKTNRLEQLIKLNNLDEEKIESTIEEILNQTIPISKDKITDIKDYNVLTKEEIKTLKEQFVSVSEYILNQYGKRKLKDIKENTRETISMINAKFAKAVSKISKQLFEQSKQDVIGVMKNTGYTSKEIEDFLNGYANDYEKELYSNVLETFLYYSRPLKTIEVHNYSTIKRTNYLIEKRKWDLQHNNKIDESGYRTGVNFAEMRKRIEKHLGKTIKEKGFRQRAYGIYSPGTDEIRVKDVSDIGTTIHEFGHRFDFKEIKRASTPEINKELTELCKRAFKNTYDKDAKLTLIEGWAEFVRRFVCDNEQTLKEYPNTSNFFMNEMENNKQLRNTVTDLIDMVETYIHTNPKEAALQMLSIGETQEQTKTLKDRIDSFMETWFDDYWALKNVAKAQAKAQNKKYYDIVPTNNIYNYKRLAKRNEETIRNIMERGFIDDRGIKATKGLKEIYAPFKKKPKKMNEIRALLYARRNLDYMVKDLASGLGITDTINLITSITDKDVINAVQEIEEFANYPFELAYKRGMISRDEYNNIKEWNKYYVPLKRVFENETEKQRSRKGSLIKRRTGSQRTIVDFNEAIVQNTVFMLDKITQNEAMQILERNAELEGMSKFYSIVPIPQQYAGAVSLDMFKNALEEEIGSEKMADLNIDLNVVKNLFSPKLSDDKTRTLTYMSNGKLKAIQFHNDSLYKIMSNSDMSKIDNAFKLFDMATGVLRSGATALNVEFSLPNAISDTFVAWVYSDSGFIPVIDTLKGVFDYAVAEYGKGNKDTENTRLYNYYRQSGASMSTRVASYRPEVQNFLEDIIGEWATFKYADDVSKTKEFFKQLLKKAERLPHGIQDFLSIIPELSEQSTRFEYFKKTYKKYIKKGYTHRNAMLQAGIETKEITLDFNRAGKAMRTINRLYAFTNAAVQGVYKAGEQATRKLPKILGKTMALVALYSIIKGLTTDEDDKKRLEEVPSSVKKDNYVFVIGDNIIKIKKPQDPIIRETLSIVDLTNSLLTGEDDVSEALTNFTADTIGTFTPLDIDPKKDFVTNVAVNLTPTGIKPMVEAGADTNLYYGSQITPYGTEKNSPQYQYDAYTSKVAIWLGEKTGQSPEKIQHLITGYGAEVAKRILDIGDAIIDASLEEITLPKQGLSEKIIIKRFVVNENKNSQSVSDVYDTYEKLETKKADSKFTGEELTKEEQETFEKMKQAKETFSEISAELKTIQNSLKYNAQEKREKIDELQALRTDVARYYLGKDLLNESNKEEIELYEYYPPNSTYDYKPKKGLKVTVTYTEADKQEYAKLAKEYYEKEIKELKKQEKYKEASIEEKEKQEESVLTKARNYAKEQVSKKVYERDR